MGLMALQEGPLGREFNTTIIKSYPIKWEGGLMLEVFKAIRPWELNKHHSGLRKKR